MGSFPMASIDISGFLSQTVNDDPLYDNIIFDIQEI